MRLRTAGSGRRRRAAAAAVVAAALLGGTSGCGTESDTADAAKLTPAQAVSRAAETTTGLTSLRYRVTGTVPEHGRIRAEASMGVDPTVMRMKITGLGDAADKPVEIRFVDGALYTQADTKVLGDTSGRHWAKAAPAVWGSGPADNRSYGVLPRQLEGSPLVQSTILAGARKVRKAGTETVDGTRTTHYAGEVTSKGLRKAQTAARDRKTRELRMNGLDQFLGLSLRSGSELAMDLWVDGDGRAKRFRLRGDTRGLDAKGRDVDTGPLDLTFTFLEADASVGVEPPAADDTVDIGELVDRAREG
ncbi:hypothetical protein [Streptomyces neyagawaensis]|uniref:hypothetical protein n=1 Tax=Streptomyces neyagawaensis TaxID=42238 RepID=UPI000B16C4AB|nr:hypothetical protein [Streptomyces neyagawaensis]MCL6735635.1 hypothetical protein [Streptomyces neyagawaensis]MDE1681290.1 hypothetical protein [Streptomyces neyagawaensis]